MEYQVINFNGDRVAHAVGGIIAVKYELAKAIPPVEVSLLTGYAHFIWASPHEYIVPIRAR